MITKSPSSTISVNHPFDDKGRGDSFLNSYIFIKKSYIDHIFWSGNGYVKQKSPAYKVLQAGLFEITLISQSEFFQLQVPAPH